MANGDLTGAVMPWLHSPTVMEVVILLLAIMAVLSLLLSLFGMRRPPPEDSYGAVARLNDLVQRLTIQVTDLHQGFSKDQSGVLDRVGRLQHELTLLQAQVENLSQIVLADTQEKRGQGGAAEKKTAEIERFFANLEAKEKEPIVVAPVAPPAAAKQFEESMRAIQEELQTLQVKPSVHEGLQKTRRGFLGRFKELFAGKDEVSPQLLDELEELLITSDLGVKTSQKILTRLRELGKDATESKVRNELKSVLRDILESPQDPEIVPQKRDGGPLVIVVVGVNGVGKTTTIGKLAKQFSEKGARVLVGACDTFRAAAADQLEVWAERAGVEIVTGPEGAKPSTVAYTATHRAREEGFDVLIVDTAGRLHTRVNLMNELVNVVKLIEREIPGSPHEMLLVVDATTGQNGLQQAREFHDKVKLTGIVVTKLDGSPKGGIVVAIKEELGVPIRYIGVGESADALQSFAADAFVEGLLEDSGPAESSSETSERAQVRRRRREDGADAAVS